MEGSQVEAPAPKAFYVTVAIDYPNGEPHVGHAYEKVVADALVRYAGLRGRPAFLLAGNDEHSQNVLKAARERGVDPETYCAGMAEVFRGAWDRLGVRYDEFMRTGDARHTRAVQTLVQRLHDRGHVYRGTYRGWYCVSCEAFITEKELREGRLCPIHGRPVDPVEEDNWFFRLSAFTQAVMAHVEQNSRFIQPESRRHEVLNVLRDGLEDISISRARAGWGVPLPWDTGQVVYVWFDALITYLSGAGFGWDDARFTALWPADLHLIGKDITRFHCVIWPAMLLAAGLPLPRTVYGHGFLNVRGEKLSKTTGNVVDPVRFQERYGLDATRWYLLAETAFGHDGNFAPDTFAKRYNSDLANDIGNLLSRGVAMIERFAGGRIPAPPLGSDAGFAAAAATAADGLAAAMDGLRVHEGPAALLGLCARANKYIDTQAPWDLARRGETERLAAVLYNIAETLRVLAIGLSPFLLEAPRAMFRQLGLAPGDIDRARWEDLRWGGLPPGTAVCRGAPLFARLEVDAVLADEESFGGFRAPAPASDAGQEGFAAERSTPVASPVSGQEAGGRRSPGATEGLGEASTRPAVPRGSSGRQARDDRAARAPEQPLISLDEFRRIDLRVATVMSADKVPGSDRLLCLDIDLGPDGRRQIVSGIAEHYRPESLLGKQIVVVANLEPATIRGVRSEGMLLAASGGGALRLLGPDGPVGPGASAR